MLYPPPLKVLNCCIIELVYASGEVTTWQHLTINHWHLWAKGKHVISLLWWLYCDDTSGNRSKKWNEHNSFLASLAGLPREKMQQEYNVHFLCTSNIAQPLEMMDGVVDDFEYISFFSELNRCSYLIRYVQENGIEAYDCMLGEDVLAITAVLALLGDESNAERVCLSCGLAGEILLQVLLDIWP